MVAAVRKVLEGQRARSTGTLVRLRRRVGWLLEEEYGAGVVAARLHPCPHHTSPPRRPTVRRTRVDRRTARRLASATPPAAETPDRTGNRAWHRGHRRPATPNQPCLPAQSRTRPRPRLRRRPRSPRLQQRHPLRQLPPQPLARAKRRAARQGRLSPTTTHALDTIDPWWNPPWPST